VYEGVLFRIGITVVLAASLYTYRHQARIFLPCLAAVVIVVPVAWSSLLVATPMLFVIGCVLESAFFVTLAGLVLTAVMRRYLATIQSIFGAICAYLLLGLAWAMLYWATERIETESLRFATRPALTDSEAEQPLPAFSRVLYFSFITMSTVGYGDIVPETPVAQTIAWMQSVAGQFYLAILVAWLVAALRIGAPSEVDRGGGPLGST
jgi:hypothetical protein